MRKKERCAAKKGLLRNVDFCHSERSEESRDRRDSSAFGLRMTPIRVFCNSPKKGFTLMELILVIAFSGILAGMAVPMTAVLVDSFAFSLDRKDLSGSAEAALKRMGREMRRLRNATNVVTAGSGTYRFVNSDGNTVQFSLSGIDLQRFDGVNTDVLAVNVASLNFTYLDDNLAAIDVPKVSPLATDIKFVQITIGISAGTNTINYTTLIRLRNVTQQSDLFT